MAIVSYKKDSVYVKPTNLSTEWKREELIQVGSLRYGRRGENNYYAMIALFDSDLLKYHQKEHLSVNGKTYVDVIDGLYDLVFNN